MSFSGKERWPSLIMALLLAFVMGLPATGWAQQPAEGEGEAAGAEGAPQEGEPAAGEGEGAPAEGEGQPVAKPPAPKPKPTTSST